MKYESIVAWLLQKILKTQFIKKKYIYIIMIVYADEKISLFYINLYMLYCIYIFNWFHLTISYRVFIRVGIWIAL